MCGGVIVRREGVARPCQRPVRPPDTHTLNTPPPHQHQSTAGRGATRTFQSMGDGEPAATSFPLASLHTGTMSPAVYRKASTTTHHTRNAAVSAVVNAGNSTRLGIVPTARVPTRRHAMATCVFTFSRAVCGEGWC